MIDVLLALAATVLGAAMVIIGLVGMLVEWHRTRRANARIERIAARYRQPRSLQ
jgi:hypothetical protein